MLENGMSRVLLLANRKRTSKSKDGQCNGQKKKDENIQGPTKH